MLKLRSSLETLSKKEFLPQCIQFCNETFCCRCEEVKELISYDRKNEHFLLKYIKSIEELIATKEKFA
jgi:hypothetical protein